MIEQICVSKTIAGASLIITLLIGLFLGWLILDK